MTSNWQPFSSAALSKLIHLFPPGRIYRLLNRGSSLWISLGKVLSLIMPSPMQRGYLREKGLRMAWKWLCLMTDGIDHPKNPDVQSISEDARTVVNIIYHHWTFYCSQWNQTALISGDFTQCTHPPVEWFNPCRQNSGSPSGRYLMCWFYIYFIIMLIICSQIWKDNRSKRWKEKNLTFEMERRIFLMCLYILDSLHHVNWGGNRLIFCNCIPNFTISRCWRFWKDSLPVIHLGLLFVHRGLREHCWLAFDLWSNCNLPYFCLKFFPVPLV